MKKLSTKMALLTCFVAVPLMADTWYNRPAVLNAARKLATEIEHFDEALHDAGAPTPLIQKAHHTEETVTEFVDLVANGFTYHEALAEFNHIREDVRFITDELYRYPHLLQYPKVASEFRYMKLAYRHLDHEMFRGGAILNGTMSPLTDAEQEQYDREVQELDAHLEEMAQQK